MSSDRLPRRQMRADVPGWVVAALLCLCGRAGAEAPAAPGGAVSFLSGQALLVRADGSSRILSPGDLVAEGDRIRTSANSHVYVRLRDGGLLVVRPASELRVQQWRYDAADPTAAGISYTLESGVARHVSGDAAKAAKERFRFNTPVAAIGVRGTDFTVTAEPKVTRVAVRTGAVVVARLGNGCRADALGPCQGPATVELSAQAADRLAQVRQSDRRPEILDANAEGARTSETRQAALRRSSVEESASVSRTSLQIDSLVAVEVDRPREEPVRPRVDVPPVEAPAEPSRIRWGRWAELAAADPGVVSAREVLEGASLVAINDLYVMSQRRSSQLQALPGSGQVQFKLLSHDGWMRDLVSGESAASAVSASSLTIDFARRRFDTALDVASALGRASLRSTGTVEADGRFASDFFISSTRVQGTVSAVAGSPAPKAADAAYLYQSQLTERLQASGVALWRP